jgi:putative SOS response-associated peptidase YedK
MCGRFVVARADGDLVPLLEIDQVAPDLPGPSYNIAPSEPVAIVLASTKPGQAGRHLAAARWGLVTPGWRPQVPTPFNARIEKVPTGGLYRRAFARHRAIIPVSGFYERTKQGRRQSYYIHPADDSWLTFAGLYEWWRDRSRPEDDPGAWLLSTTIITHPAQGQMTSIHDREPLYLDPSLWADWLDPDTPGDATLLAAVEAASTPLAATLDFRLIDPAWLTTTPGKKRDDAGLIAAAG